MKQGQTLMDLATEIQRQAETKRDFISPGPELRMKVDADAPIATRAKFEVNGYGTFGIKETAHDQLASRLQIPKAYYDRMKENAPALLENNVNHWLGKSRDKKMVRTLDGNVRAFLSNRYRALDNLDLAETVLPILHRNGVRVESAALTEQRLYIKAVTERITTEIKVGDTVQAGIVISNSEIGLGSVKIEPMVFRLVCLNGMISNDHSLRKYHVGRQSADVDLAEEFFKDSTRQADDRAFWMKVRDVVEGSFRQDVFERIVNRMREATERQIEGDPVKVIEVTQKKLGLTDSERGSVLSWLIKDGDLTQFGLSNAVTRASQDVPDYERATELERLGSAIIELPKSDWNVIATAA